MKAHQFKKLHSVNWAILFRRHVLAVVLFFFMSWMLMGKSLTSCQTTVISAYPGGDHVAGIIWLFTYTPSVYGGISHVTNFPYGEDLAQPQYVTSALTMVPTWALSKVVGPTCGWNLMVLAGYMLSAMSMYAFIYWLIRRRSIAVFAGVLATFTPYHYYKSWGHLSYMQSQLFILLLWACLAFWKTPTSWKGVTVGILTGLLFYADGYFPMIGGVMLGSLVLYGLLDTAMLWRKKRDQKITSVRLKYAALAVAVTFVMLLPIVAVKLKYGNQINASLTSSRSDIKEELARYGARLADYVIPSDQHPIEPIRDVATDYRQINHYSNPGEYSLYLGVISLALAAYAVAIFIRRSTKLSKEYSFIRWVAGACLSIIVFSGLLSLVPAFKLAGRTITLPSGVVGQFVSLWRVYARLYMVVSIAVATLAAIGLWQLSLRIKNPRKALLLIAVLSVVAFIDLLPINPFSRTDEQSLVNDAYPTYSWLAGQSDITAVAAYPLLEHPFNSSYFGDQVMHKKQLLNSVSVKSNRELHRALTGLLDPQTLGGLKALGLNHILGYQIPADQSPLLIRQFGDFGASVFKIDDSVRPLSHILVPDATFLIPSVDLSNHTSCRQASVASSSIALRPLVNNARPELIEASFTLRGQPDQKVLIHDGDSVLYSTSFDSKSQLRPVSLTVPSDKTLYLYHLSEPTKGFVDVCNLGVSGL